MIHLRAMVALVVWTTGVIAGLYALDRLGQSAYPTPPATDSGTLVRWVANTPPLLAAGSVLRLVAIGAGWYLLVTTVVGIFARALGLRRTVRLLDRFTLPVVRQLVGRAVGIGLAAQVSLLGAAPALAAPPEAAVATMEAMPPSTTTMRALPEVTATTTMRALPEVTTTTTMRALPEVTASMRALPDAAAAEEATSRPNPSAASSEPLTWTVRPGDHLWRVAEVVLTLHQGASPSEHDIDTYVDRLVLENQHRLPDPANPDLVLPGQVLVLPLLDP